MNLPLGARVAIAWAHAYTASLAEPARSDRRAEIEADVHDQLAAGAAEGLPHGAASRRIALRALRGSASDLAWRLETEWAIDRFRSLVRGTAVRTALFVALVPTVFVWDAQRARLAPEDVGSSGAGSVVKVLAAVLLAHVVARTVQGFALFGGRVPRPRPRRLVSGLLIASFAAAALWRDAAAPFEQVAAAAWALFGAAALGWLLAELVGLVRRQASRGLDFRKVPS